MTMLPPEYQEGLAVEGWIAIKAEPAEGDEGRREMGFTGFGGLKPPVRVGAKFPIGTVMFTPGARAVLSLGGAMNFTLARELLERFLQGDWGTDTPPERAGENQAALGGGGRIAAFYSVGFGMGVWLVSDWDRRQTTYVGAGEYR